MKENSIEAFHVAKEFSRESTEEQHYQIRYKTMEYGNVGTFYTKSNEIIEHGVLGPRVLKIAGEYGVEFVGEIIEGVKKLDLQNIDKQEVVSLLEAKQIEVAAIQ